jgi:twitching motility protein PilT
MDTTFLRAKEFDRLLTAMLQSAPGISDLLFIAGKPPQVETHGALEVYSTSAPALEPSQIETFARGILQDNPKLMKDLAERGSCDCSYALADSRFRVNIYKQNGSFAMVMRRLQSEIPSLESLGLPAIFNEVIKEKNGLIFVTGGAGNGKTTTLAAMLGELNRTQKSHVVTLEDPVEFLHPHALSTFSQRELGRDFFNFPDGLRAALRQAPKVILVGEIRDRETMEIALSAGETGHAVYATLHTVSASQTVNRILGLFEKHEEQQVRERLASVLRFVIGQRLVPKKTGGRLLVTELMGSSLRTREAVELGENENRRLHEIIEAGVTLGWHSFEQALLKAFEDDQITEEIAMQHCGNRSVMRQRLDSAKSRGAGRFAKRTTNVQMVAAVPPPLPAIPPQISSTLSGGARP